MKLQKVTLLLHTGGTDFQELYYEKKRAWRKTLKC